MSKSDLAATSSLTEGDAPSAETPEPPATPELETEETRERAGSDSSKIATLRNTAGRQVSL